MDRLNAAIDRWAGAAGRWRERRWPWAPALAVAAGLALAALAPLCMALGWEGVARPIYWLYSFFCHQRPERTLWLAGHPMAFCARDTGVYLGIGLGAAAGALLRRPLLCGWAALALCLPLALDGGSQWIGLRESTNPLRIATGLLAGAAVAAYLLSRIGRELAPPAGELCQPTSDDLLLSDPCRET